MSICDVQAIDVHAHYGNCIRGTWDLIDDWMSADAAGVVERARLANTKLTIVSPLAGLMPRGEADAFAANEQASRDVQATPGLRQYVIINPLQPETYDQAGDLLREPHCVGIKLHPEEHQYPIAEHGRELFEFAARHDAIVLVHSGDPFSWPADFMPFVNEHPNVRMILAHLGNGGGAAGDATLQIRAIQQSRHDNVFVDTSSARSILPGLIEWAVAEIGSERILYGTDTPLYATTSQRARIDGALISEEDKRRILVDNATQLFGLESC